MGGYTDPYGGYADAMGGYADPYGGYADAMGGYTDPYGGYADAWVATPTPMVAIRDPYGGYADAMGGYTDAYGGYTDAYGGYTDANGRLHRRIWWLYRLLRRVSRPNWRLGGCGRGDSADTLSRARVLYRQCVTKHHERERVRGSPPRAAKTIGRVHAQATRT